MLPFNPNGSVVIKEQILPFFLMNCTFSLTAIDEINRAYLLTAIIVVTVNSKATIATVAMISASLVNTAQYAVKKTVC